MHGGGGGRGVTDEDLVAWEKRVVTEGCRLVVDVEEEQNKASRLTTSHGCWRSTSTHR